MALSFCSETQMHILQSLDVNTIFVVKEVFMNERSPSKMLQSQSEAFLGLLKAAPYLITLLSNVVLQSIFHVLRNNEIQGGGEHSNHTWRETNRTGDYTRNPLNWIKQLFS